VIERQTWTTYNAAQSEEKTRFVELLADLCSTVPQPPQHGKGRPRLRLSDMVFASVYKVYVGFSSIAVCNDIGPPLVTASEAGVPGGPEAFCAMLKDNCRRGGSTSLTTALGALPATYATPS